MKNRIEEIRKERGIRQEEFAKAGKPVNPATSAMRNMETVRESEKIKLITAESPSQ